MLGELFQFASYLMAAALLAQSQTISKPSFEVASVRADNGPFQADSFRVKVGPGSRDPGRVTITQLTLKPLIELAYAVEDDQVDGPEWLSDLADHKYTIRATMPPETTEDQFQLMLQNLLAERFNLKLHHEVRSFPGYELTVVPGGPKLSTWTPEPVPEGPIPRFSEDSRGFPVMPSGRTGCTNGFRPGITATLKVTCRQSMAGFAKDLGRFIIMANDSPADSLTPRVTDKTELPGIYEFNLEFEGTMNLRGMPSRNPANDGLGDGGASLFTALQKQVGLRLVKSTKVQDTVLVVDHADKEPSEN